MATTADADGLSAVHVASWQAAYRGLLPDRYLDRLRPDDRRDGWLRSLGDEGSGRQRTFLVVLDDGTVAGFVDVRSSRDEDARVDTTGEITALYVAPEHWDAGIGQTLTSRAIAWLREVGFGDATLWVLRGNVRARTFYERAGWSADGVEKDVVVAGMGVVEVRYRRSV